MRQIAAGLLIILVGQGLAGCASLRTLVRAQEIDRQIQADRIRFYDRMGDAYHILAFEYYKLARDAESRNQTEQAKECTARLALYDSFYRSAKKTADDLRAQALAEEQQDSPPPAAAALRPTGTTPAAPPVAPAGQRPSPANRKASGPPTTGSVDEPPSLPSSTGGRGVAPDDGRTR